MKISGLAFAVLIRQIPGRLIDYRLMRIREKQQFVRTGLAAFLRFEVLADCLSENRVAQVFLTVQDITDRGVRPEIRIMVVMVSGCHSFLFQICGRDQDLISLKCLGYGSERSAHGCHSEDPSDHLGSFRIDIQRLLIIRLKHIAIRNGPTAP